jgi:hypothetical protein
MMLLILLAVASLVMPLFLSLWLSVLSRSWTWPMQLIFTLAQLAAWVTFGVVTWDLSVDRDFGWALVAIAAAVASVLGSVSAVVLWLSTRREHCAPAATPVAAPPRASAKWSWVTTGEKAAWVLVAASVAALLRLCVEGFVFDSNDYSNEYWWAQVDEHSLSLTISALFPSAAVTLAAISWVASRRAGRTGRGVAIAAGITVLLGLAILGVGLGNVQDASNYAGLRS